MAEFDFIQAISTVGFPIVACVALFYLYNQTITKLTTTLEKIDATLEKLYQKIDNIEGRIEKLEGVQK